MSENCSGEAVCIHTDKVYDSCRAKDCLENLRVFIPLCYQDALDCAINIKCTRAEIIWVFTDIEAVPFNRGYYSVDLKYYFKITLAVFSGNLKPQIIEGLAQFDKKVILFGSEGNAKIFASAFRENAFDSQLWKKTNMPQAVVEVVDPIILGAKLIEVRENCCCDDGFDLAQVPEAVCNVFGEQFVTGGDAKRAYVTLGIFSIVKLERKTQLLIPAYDFCIPESECVGSTDDSPCDLFGRIEFPVDEFFPPEKCAFDTDITEEDNPPCDDRPRRRTTC